MMRFLRLPWRAAARRPLIVSFVLNVLVAGSTSAADVTGIVVDSTGRPLPRALVRVLDDGGAELSARFADETGRFTAPAASSCRVEASLTGFRTTQTACETAQPMRLELPLAPVEETVLVSATRTDAPQGQLAASADVFTAADLERRQVPLLAD